MATPIIITSTPIGRNWIPRLTGKARGSGKSRVRAYSEYLGTAGSIYKQLKERNSPLDVRHREFGFVAAIYQTAVETGLVSLLRQHIPGKRHGLSRWLYFLLPIEPLAKLKNLTIF